MRRLQGEPVRLVGVVSPHIALTLSTLLLLRLVTGGKKAGWRFLVRCCLVWVCAFVWYRAHFVLINGRSAREEPSLRHLPRWADEQEKLYFFFLLSSYFIHLFLLPPPPPLYLGVSCLIALGRRGDPASWLMVTPQLVTSKRGHCFLCFPVLPCLNTDEVLCTGNHSQDNFDACSERQGKYYRWLWAKWWCSDSVVSWILKGKKCITLD